MALSIANAQLRILTLRFSSEDLAGLGTRHLVYGLLVTWAVGIGRYWDHPDPYLVQSLGAGSLVLMGALGLLLYSILWPLRPRDWSLFQLYVFLSLTALPAILYAIPVERFLEIRTAQQVNVGFLAIVAVWRVAMLGRYLAKRTDLSGWILATALLLPLVLILVALTALNLEKAVFTVMAGAREPVPTPGDRAYLYIVLLTGASFVIAPLLVAAYGLAVWLRWRT